MALAGLASCRRWPEEKLRALRHRPANRMDGVAVHYATAFERGGDWAGRSGGSFDGRPIKVDGNPTHPLNQGGSDMFLQARFWICTIRIARAGRSAEKGAGRDATSWEKFARAVKGAGIGANGDGLLCWRRCRGRLR